MSSSSPSLVFDGVHSGLRVRIRHAQPSIDAGLFTAWMRRLGWAPADRDAEVFLGADREGAYVEEVADGSTQEDVEPAAAWTHAPGDGSCPAGAVLVWRPVAIVTAVCHDYYGFIGCYVAAPPYRGKGLGVFLFSTAQRVLAERCSHGSYAATLGLDAVPERVETYMRSGFSPVYKHLRFAVPASSCPTLSVPGASGKLRLCSVDEAGIDSCLAYDRSVFGAPRETFMRALLRYPGACARACIRESAGNSREVCGLMVARPVLASCGAEEEDTVKLGPWFAEDAEAAIMLLNAAIAFVSERHSAAMHSSVLVVDVPEVRAPSLEMVRASGGELRSACMRMYTAGPPTHQRLEAVWGNSTLELG